MLESNANWVLSLAVGASMIAFNCWSQFDEPSYDTSAEHFAKYRPKFATSHKRYAKAKFGYIALFLGAYCLFCFAPEVFSAVFRALGNAIEIGNPTVLPVIVAGAIITFQKAPMTKDAERRIRAFFHGLAEVPEGIRRTVTIIRGSEFALDRNVMDLLTRRLSASTDLDNIISFISDDEVTGIWFHIGSLLTALGDDKRDSSGIDPLFFASYKGEFESIADLHTQYSEPLRRHVSANLKSPSSIHSKSRIDGSIALLADLRNLRDRLYTFVACGARSSVNTEIENARILNNLGFSAQYSPARGNILVMIGPIAGLSFLSIMIVSVFTGFLTEIFRKSVLHPLGDLWAPAFPVPSTVIGIYLWSWTTAIYYASAIIGAIMFREWRILERRWFDINQPKRARPVLNYIWPILLGTVLGCVVLVAIAFVNGPGFHFEINRLTALQEAIKLSFPWYPLAIAIAAISLWLVDSDMPEGGNKSLVTRSLLGALFMAIIGFLTSEVSIGNTVQAFAQQHGLELTNQVSRTSTYVSLFIATLISIFAALLCFIVQASEMHFAKTRRLANVLFDVAPRRGPAFTMVLEENGRASARATEEIDAPSALFYGKWLQFPEGTVVWWDQTEKTGLPAGGIGIISRSGEYLVYEGYENRIEGRAKIVARLDHPRPGRDLNVARPNYHGLPLRVVSSHGS